MTSPGGTTMSLKLKEILNDIQGVVAIDYGLIAALVSLAAIFAMSSLGSLISTHLRDVAALIQGVLG